MPRNELPDVPSMTANRDEAVASAPRGAIPSRGNRPAPASPGSSSLLLRLGLTVACVVAAVACAWAFQLQQTLDLSEQEQVALSSRVADLEALLSDTDETVNKSSAALGAQLKVVDTETRRLEQRRREHDSRIEKLEKSTASLSTQLGKVETTTASQGKTVAALSGDLASLKKVAGELERLAATAKQSQTNMERLADSVNKANLERSAMAKRVESNEQWIESINAFRKQVNANISRLDSALRAAQSSSSGQPLQ